MGSVVTLPSGRNFKLQNGYNAFNDSRSDDGWDGDRLDGQVTAIDCQDRTRCPGRFVAGKVDGETSHIFGLPETADGVN